MGIFILAREDLEFGCRKLKPIRMENLERRAAPSRRGTSGMGPLPLVLGGLGIEAATKIDYAWVAE